MKLCFERGRNRNSDNIEDDTKQDYGNQQNKRCCNNGNFAYDGLGNDTGQTGNK